MDLDYVGFVDLKKITCHHAHLFIVDEERILFEKL